MPAARAANESALAAGAEAAAAAEGDAPPPPPPPPPPSLPPHPAAGGGGTGAPPAASLHDVSALECLARYFKAGCAHLGDSQDRTRSKYVVGWFRACATPAEWAALKSGVAGGGGARVEFTGAALQTATILHGVVVDRLAFYFQERLVPIPQTLAKHDKLLASSIENRVKTLRALANPLHATYTGVNNLPEVLAEPGEGAFLAWRNEKEAAERAEKEKRAAVAASRAAAKEAAKAAGPPAPAGAWTLGGVASAAAAAASAVAQAMREGAGAPKRPRV